MTSSKIRPCRVKGNKEKITLICANQNCPLPEKKFKVYQSIADEGRKYCSMKCNLQDRFNK